MQQRIARTDPPRILHGNRARASLPRELLGDPLYSRLYQSTATMTSVVTIKHHENRQLRDVIEAVTRPTDRLKVTASEAAVSLAAINGKRSFMSSATLRRCHFDTLDGATLTGTVDADALYSAIRSFNKTDPIKLTIDPDEIEIDSPEDDAETVEFNTDTDSATEIPDPDVTRDTAVEVPAKKLKRAVRGLNKIANEATMEVVDGQRPLRLYGNESDDLTQPAPEHKEAYGYPPADLVSNPPQNPLRWNFSLTYLRQATLSIARPASTTVTLSLGNGGDPIRWEFTVNSSGASSDGIDVTFNIAPRRVGDEPAAFDSVSPEQPHVAEPALELTTSGGSAAAIMDTISGFADAYFLRATPSQLEAQAVDEKRVGMNDVVYDASRFDTYHAAPELQGTPFVLTDELESILRLWRKNDDFALRFDADDGQVELVHDVLRYRIPTGEPADVYSKNSTFELQVTGQATADPESLAEAVDTLADEADIISVAITGDGLFVLAPDVDPKPVSTTEIDGRGFAVFSASYLTDAVAGSIADESDAVVLRTGVETPIALDFDLATDSSRAFRLVAPRITDEYFTRAEPLADSIATADDMSWVQNPATLDCPYQLLPDVRDLSNIEDRAEEYAYSHYPVRTTATVPDSTATAQTPNSSSAEETLRIANRSKLNVADETLDAVRTAIEQKLALDVLESGQSVATVVFTSETDFEIEYDEPTVAIERRLDTDDGVRLQQADVDTADTCYLSPASRTPISHGRIAVFLRNVDADQFTVHLGVTDADGSLSESVTLDDTPQPKPQAYQQLISMVESRTLEELVAASPGALDITVEDFAHEITELIGDAAAWTSKLDPYGEDDVAVLSGEAALLPDMTWQARIVVEANTDSTTEYRTRLTVQATPCAPNWGGDDELLVDEHIGTVSTRTGIIACINDAFDDLNSYAVWLDPRSVEGPDAWTPPTDSSWVSAYLPASKQEIVDAIETADDEIPVQLTDVDRIGPARADALCEDGITDTIDATAYLATHADKASETAYTELSSSAKANLRDVSTAIWTTAIKPRRPLPDAFTSTTAEAPPAGEPTSNTSQAPTFEFNYASPDPEMAPEIGVRGRARTTDN